MPKSRRDSGSGSAETQHLVADPFPTVVTTAQVALELFTTGRDIPLREDVPTPSTVPRTTRTTTVTTQAGLLSRAIYLTTLAQGNFAFFQKNAFGTPEGVQSAQRALQELERFLTQNGRSLARVAERNIAFVNREIAQTGQELRALEAALREENVPEAKAVIEGNINLANLRTLRLQALLVENQQIAAFVSRSEGRTSRKH